MGRGGALFVALARMAAGTTHVVDLDGAGLQERMGVDFSHSLPLIASIDSIGLGTLSQHLDSRVPVALNDGHKSRCF